MKDDELLEKVEAFQELLIDYSTGGDVKEEEYKRLRRELLSNPKVKDELPEFVQNCRSLRQFWSFIKSESGNYEGRRRFIWSRFAPALNKLERGLESPADDSITEALASLDAGHVDRIWHKALERKEKDPEGAVTAARTLLESVCKTILDEMEIDYEDKTDLPEIIPSDRRRIEFSSWAIFRRVVQENFRQLSVSGWHVWCYPKCS